ncbi:hypothetical protein [Acetivibrio mesophilus]|uniref:Uncharacterized protein n=1 Tax=Acetivibrio mesophilus TaxID=2487273 RepID=A0A4Q0I407_9FIRM|nr:hypothetical protein [Acetivibrio mesophilus]ODM27048.1 hypothetical protein A7W90_12975 [Clostridium sp. Bc-iso-3]RXE58507.1 hypothetical protein EFD62_12035 [Acetivibrio mesophilus]HHV28787.1 hypothetical protein [Clostridium sp.]
MDKRVNKMVPLSFDLKTVSYAGYFILLAFAAAVIFHLVLMGGAVTKYISLQTSVFVISVVGVLVWILTPYLEIVQPESKELILSLPIDGFRYGFLRILRLFAVYTGSVLLLLYFIYSISDGQRLAYGIIDMFLISGALFFVSGLGMVAFLLSRHLIIGFGIPVLWVAISFFYRGGASWFWHTCQWINPKPFESSLKYAVAHWVTGIVLYVMSAFIIEQRKYLMR